MTKDNEFIPATGARAAALENISNRLRQFADVVELERSGARDGDGYWHGCHAFDESRRQLEEAFRELDTVDRVLSMERGDIPRDELPF